VTVGGAHNHLSHLLEVLYQLSLVARAGGDHLRVEEPHARSHTGPQVAYYPLQLHQPRPVGAVVELVIGSGDEADVVVAQYLLSHLVPIVLVVEVQQNGGGVDSDLHLRTVLNTL